MGTKIGAVSLTDWSYLDITDLDKVHLPAADKQSGVGDGVSIDLTLLDIQQIAFMRPFASTAHGLVSGDVGKALSAGELFDDESSIHRFSGVLARVIDANTILVAVSGAQFVFPIALLENGSSYNPADDADGRWVFWDLDQSLYVAEEPYTSHPSVAEVLEILSVGVSTFTARVL